jgi:hypothetical protein
VVAEITSTGFESAVLKSEIPMLVFFKDDKQVDSVLGAVPESMVRPKVKALL